MNEKEFIERYLKPVCVSDAALGLGDDAALMSVPLAGHSRVVTTDMMVEDIHFLATMPKEGVVHKLIHSNLSDLAAMGAKPAQAVLSVALPAHELAQWGEAINAVFASAQALGLELIGGDTCASGAAVLSLTVWGDVAGKPLRRCGAAVGDGIYLSGALAAPALGLMVWQHDEMVADWPDGIKAALKHAHLTPTARLELGQALVGRASACMDVSDGLADAVARLSAGLGADINEDILPVAYAEQLVLLPPSDQEKMLWNGGEEYELCFTMSERHEAWLLGFLEKNNLPVTRIGTVVQKKGVRVKKVSGELTSLQHQGYSHF